MGEWEPVRYRFSYLPVHVLLLKTGRILAFGGSGNDELSIDNPHPAETWDPVTGETKILPQKLGGDIFCAGQVVLGDGRALIAGGTYRYDHTIQGVPAPPFSGLEQCYLFDPEAEMWTRIEDMANGRWYPTLLQLADDRVIAMAGLTKGFPWVFLREIEIYSLGEGWKKLEGADRWLPLYPRLHLLPNGDVFYAGSYNTHYTFPFSMTAFPTSALDVNKAAWKSYGLPRRSEREEGVSVLLPLEPPDYKARVLLAGGGTTQGREATAAAEIIDLSVDNPSWQQIQPMNFARYYCYAVILPDRSIFVCGGRVGTADMSMGAGGMPAMGGQGQAPMDPSHDPLAILDTEVFDYATETWKTAAKMTVDRLYHSNAILLPDGRVMACGSNPARRTNELRIEIYHPPYLFRTSRPTVTKCPDAIGYDSSFQIGTRSEREIGAVALIRPAATTHCVNTEQRYVGLDFLATNSNTITARVPGNKNLAPPGYYMLFVVNEDGVPSVGEFVLLM
jgi:hypothetical protein